MVPPGLGGATDNQIVMPVFGKFSIVFPAVLPVDSLGRSERNLALFSRSVAARKKTSKSLGESFIENVPKKSFRDTFVTPLPQV